MSKVSVPSFPPDNLQEINRNQNGDYYFIFSVNNVKNHINPKAKSRDEVIIVGVPKSKLVFYLKNLFRESN